MKHFLKRLYFLLSIIRLIPHWLLFNLHPKAAVIQYDTTRWLGILNINNSLQYGFLYLMSYVPEFRNLFYYRIMGYAKLIRVLCPPLNSLYIVAKRIGPGLFIQHGFATIIDAQSIGRDCWINQQVTIGYSNATDHPIIQDNVTVYAGAKIIGKVTIGHNSKVGANAVVVKDVPANCTVVGVPAYIVKRNGIRIKEKL